VRRCGLEDGQTYLYKSTVNNKLYSINRDAGLIPSGDAKIDGLVKLTSAMFVAAITFRVPRSATLNTLNCSSVLKPACKARGIICVAPRGSLDSVGLWMRIETKQREKYTHVGMSSVSSSKHLSISSRPVRNMRMSPVLCWGQ